MGLEDGVKGGETSDQNTIVFDGNPITFLDAFMQRREGFYRDSISGIIYFVKTADGGKTIFRSLDFDRVVSNQLSSKERRLVPIPYEGISPEHKKLWEKIRGKYEQHKPEVKDGQR